MRAYRELQLRGSLLATTSINQLIIPARVQIHLSKSIHQTAKSIYQHSSNRGSSKLSTKSEAMARRMIDIGANLTDPMFRGIYNGNQKHHDDFDDMIKRARDHGVEKMIITGGSLEDSRAALEISKKHDFLYSTVGCHPTRCEEFNAYPNGPEDYLRKLEDLASSSPSKVVAIGELGLDYDRLHFCDAMVQKKYFEMQLELAESLRLPLFLHNRNSINDLLEILKLNKSKLEVCGGGVVHSFDGSESDMKSVLDLGLYIGLNGCSLKTEANLQTIKAIPSDRLLIETDCPWCEIRRSHAGFRHVKSVFDKCKDAKNPKLAVKNRNEPMNLIQVMEVVAAVRDENIDQLSERIFENTNRLFFNK